MEGKQEGPAAGVRTRSAATAQEQGAGVKGPAGDEQPEAAGCSKRRSRKDGPEQQVDPLQWPKRSKAQQHASNSAGAHAAATTGINAGELQALTQLCSTPEGASAILQQDSSLQTLLSCLEHGEGDMAQQAAAVLENVAACDGASAVLCKGPLLAALARCLHTPGAGPAAWAVASAASTPEGADAVLQLPGVLGGLAHCLGNASTDVVQQACYAIGTLASSGERGANAVGQQSGLLLKVRMCMLHASPDVLQAALSVLVDVSCHSTGSYSTLSEVYTVAMHGILACLESDRSRVLEMAAAALARLVSGCGTCGYMVLCDVGGVLGLLTQLLQHSSPGVVERAAVACAALTHTESHPTDGLAPLARQPGLLAALLRCMQSDNTGGAQHAAHVVAELAYSPGGTNSLLRMQDPPAVTILLQGLSSDVEGEAARALDSMASHIGHGYMAEEHHLRFVSVLLENLEHEDEGIRGQVMWGLGLVARSPAAAEVILQRDGILPLLMRSLASPENRESAAPILEALMKHGSGSGLSPVWELLGQHVAAGLQKSSIIDLERNLQQAIVLAARLSAAPAEPAPSL